MDDADTRATEALANRSNFTVLAITAGFAIVGALLDMGGSFLPGKFSMLWGMWIPLCFLLIPSVHYLARQSVALRKRLAAMEARLGSQTPHDG